jgi:hypothetical protein
MKIIQDIAGSLCLFGIIYAALYLPLIFAN